MQVRFKGDKIRQGKSRGRSRYRREGHRVEQWGMCLQLWGVKTETLVQESLGDGEGKRDPKRRPV